MSEENVEVVREMWSAYNARNVDRSLDYFAEDCVVEDVPDLPDRAIYKGRKGVQERNLHFRKTWGDWAWELEEFIDAGDDVVVAMLVVRAHGSGSGTPVEAKAAFVYEVRDGKIVRDRPFTSRSQALEAAGLSE